jgi:hypothetical protein
MNNREMGIKVLSNALNQGPGSRELRQRLKILKEQK